MSDTAESWTCDVCGTAWLERPVPTGIHGCPECGNIPAELLDPERRHGIVGWILHLLQRWRTPTLEVRCPADSYTRAEWAHARRAIFDRQLRCTRCGAPIPSATHRYVRWVWHGRPVDAISR